MCSKKSCYVVPIFLLIIIAALCAYIFLCTECKDKKTKSADINNTNETNSENIKVKNNYTYNDIAGYYKFTESNPNNQELTFGYNLYLSKNGTFKYQYTMNTASSIIGNYIVVEDEIHLNYLFIGGSDASITSTSGEKVLKINDTNAITDNDAHFASQGGSKTIDLVKDNNTEINDNDYDVNYIINNYGLFNNANTNY